MTIIEATVVYNNIVTMINNDRDALTSYLMRLWFENTPMNDGPKTETDKLHKALGIVIEECERLTISNCCEWGPHLVVYLKSSNRHVPDRFVQL
jgi:hypothetical protein